MTPVPCAEQSLSAKTTAGNRELRRKISDSTNQSNTVAGESLEAQYFGNMPDKIIYRGQIWIEFSAHIECTRMRRSPAKFQMDLITLIEQIIA